MKWKQEPYRVGHSGYVSEFDKFLNSYMSSHPDIESDQQHGWYIYWDHRVNLDELDKERKDSVPTRPYSYE